MAKTTKKRRRSRIVKRLLRFTAFLMTVSICCFALYLCLRPGTAGNIDAEAAAAGAIEAPGEVLPQQGEESSPQNGLDPGALPTEEEPQVTEPVIIPSKPEPYVADDGCWYIDLDGVPVLLVNKVYGLPETFGGSDPEADGALYDMFAAAEQDGIYLYLVSGYRSYQYQYELHESYTQKWGDEYTDKVSAEAGHSEHQTGMAYDILSSDHEGGLTNSFKDTAGGQWLKEHCWEHGFILRYPEGKEPQTGYIFEPWHFRYIGDTALAKAITDSGLCLEEYADLV